MTKNRRGLFTALSGVAFALAMGLAMPSANAADVADVCQPFASTIDVGYMIGSDLFLGKSFSNGFGTFFGEAAALYHFCDSNLNVQADAAYFDHRFKAGTDDRWHAGGILFWREQDRGVLGVDASYLGQKYVISNSNSDRFRVGARGEYFGGDNFTLGAGVGYVSGNLFGKATNGFDSNVWAKLYPTDNLALLARFDYGSQNWAPNTLTELAATGEAEYLIPNHPVSLFIGGRYGSVTVAGAGTPSTIDTEEGFVGFKVYLGSNGQGGSLASQQRNNTLDNTSVLFEKLPELGGP